MDRFVRGLIAGTLGAVIMNIWDFTSFYILKFSTVLYLDWASIVIYGNKPVNSIEYVFSLFSQIAWSGLLGVIFAFLIPHITSGFYLIKGAFYGFITSFIIFSVPILFKFTNLANLSTTTAISHALGATLWGIITALILHWLETTSKIRI